MELLKDPQIRTTFSGAPRGGKKVSKTPTRTGYTPKETAADRAADQNAITARVARNVRKPSSTVHAGPKAAQYVKKAMK